MGHPIVTNETLCIVILCREGWRRGSSQITLGFLVIFKPQTIRLNRWEHSDVWLCEMRRCRCAERSTWRMCLICADHSATKTTANAATDEDDLEVRLLIHYRPRTSRANG